MKQYHRLFKLHGGETRRDWSRSNHFHVRSNDRNLRAIRMQLSAARLKVFRFECRLRDICTSGDGDKRPANGMKGERAEERRGARKRNIIETWLNSHPWFSFLDLIWFAPKQIKITECAMHFIMTIDDGKKRSISYACTRRNPLLSNVLTVSSPIMYFLHSRSSLLSSLWLFCRSCELATKLIGLAPSGAQSVYAIWHQAAEAKEPAALAREHSV